MPKPECYRLERCYWHAHPRERTRGCGTKHPSRRLFHSPGRIAVRHRLRERPYGELPSGRNTGPDTAAGGPAGPEPEPEPVVVAAAGLPLDASALSLPASTATAMGGERPQAQPPGPSAREGPRPRRRGA